MARVPIARAGGRAGRHLVPRVRSESVRRDRLLFESQLTRRGGAIALVGLPGSGKSTIGRRLARRLELPFIDCDAEVERKSGVTIATLFQTAGEAAFRDLESQVLAELLCGAPAVVATGGGAVLRESNRRMLRERATVVFLEATPEQLGRRIRPDGKRPLLAGADVQERLARLHAERDPLYREVADLTVQPASGRPDGVVRTIVDGLERSAVGA